MSRDWSSYNRALVARGSLTVWLDDSFWRQWYDHKPCQRGAQFVYSDQTIAWMLTVRVLLRLPLRQMKLASWEWVSGLKLYPLF